MFVLCVFWPLRMHIKHFGKHIQRSNQFPVPICQLLNAIPKNHLPRPVAALLYGTYVGNYILQLRLCGCFGFVSSLRCQNPFKYSKCHEVAVICGSCKCCWSTLQLSCLRLAMILILQPLPLVPVCFCGCVAAVGSAAAGAAVAIIAKKLAVALGSPPTPHSHCV